MTPERLRQIEDLFHRALEKHESQRAAFLHDACAGDDSVRREVESLLDQAGDTDTFSISSSPKRQWPRWWMYVVAASFALMQVLLWYLTISGPTDVDGLQASFGGGAMIVNAVEPGSHLAQAGLRSGDRVVAIDGLPLRNPRDWEIVTANHDSVRPQRWKLIRGTERLELQVTPEKATLQNRLEHGGIGYGSTAIACFILALLMAFQRPSDPVAILGAWFIMTASVAFGLPLNWAVVWRQLPVVVQILLWIPAISRFVIDGILLSLFVIFPRQLFRSRWLWAALWAPVLVTLPWRIIGFNLMIHPVANTTAIPAWLNQAIFVRTIAYLMAAIVILVVGYRRLSSLSERRRVRVLVAGTAVAFAGAIFLVWYFTFIGKGLAVANPWLEQIGFILLLACPLAFYYAIIRHRAFDIHIIIRQGLQYALARGAVLGVVPLLAAALILDLALNSRQPLIEILEARGWVYGGISGLALTSYWQRKRWLGALDRRFFRERYDAQRLLRDVVQEIHESKDFEHLCPRVVARIEEALHPEFVWVMVRQPDDRYYRTIASVPPGQARPPLAADGKLVGLIRLLGKPLETFSSGAAWLEQRLPRPEVAFIRKAGIDLIIPIATNPGAIEALLVLGMKRSEEPYTREDQELLEAIASSLALLLDRPASSREVAVSSFEECPECGVCYELGSGTCRVDRTTLTAVRLPRLLADRYRLERRRGRGGMGTVYEARDRALERPVAVKVIRDDWAGNSEAVHRFRREARAAASFTDSNVVTVYDYGVAQARGFLVMELLEGNTLRDELDRTKRLPSDQILKILSGVCAAVDAAHRRQLIHRDLKPENIFLARGESTEIVKVLDFGIAKFMDNAAASSQKTTLDTQTGVLIGTLAYMSSEQLLGGEPDLSWDLWALTVLAYEALTGTMPFGQTASGDWRRRVLAGDFAPLKLHPSRNDFFARQLSANPSKRAHSAAEFLRELENALA